MLNPTKLLVLTLNYMNEQMEMMMQVNIVIQKTDEGLYMVDFATNRVRLEFKDQR